MHSNQQSAIPHLALVILVHVTAGQFVHLFHYQVPTAQIEITHAEINTLHPSILDDAAKPVRKLYVYVVVYPRHFLLVRDMHKGYNSYESGRYQTKKRGFVK